jgi:GDP-D-mannose dehydratase
VGNPTKAEKQLDWAPKTQLLDLVKIMVNADRTILERQLKGNTDNLYQGL